MATRLPSEPVYHYECSAGRFRLVYFLPPGFLKELHVAGNLSEEALDDFPDGVDLGCTEADFHDFEAEYGWRPGTSPDELRQAFLTLFSSTRGWKAFRGSGRIAGRDLERHLGRVRTELTETGIAPAAARDFRPATAGERRGVAARKRKVRRALEALPAEGIDPTQDLKRQDFSQIEMHASGDPAELVFSRVHQKRRR